MGGSCRAGTRPLLVVRGISLCCKSSSLPFRREWGRFKKLLVECWVFPGKSRQGNLSDARNHRSSQVRVGVGGHGGRKTPCFFQETTSDASDCPLLSADIVVCVLTCEATAVSILRIECVACATCLWFRLEANFGLTRRYYFLCSKTRDDTSSVAKPHEMIERHDVRT